MDSDGTFWRLLHIFKKQKNPTTFLSVLKLTKLERRLTL